MLEQSCVKISVDINGTIVGENTLKTMAVIFQKYLFSCPRHELGVPPDSGRLARVVSVRCIR